MFCLQGCLCTAGVPSEARGEPRRSSWNWSYIESQATMWVPGAKHRSSSAEARELFAPALLLRILILSVAVLFSNMGSFLENEQTAFDIKCTNLDPIKLKEKKDNNE